MGKELCYIIDQISREKGIQREFIIKALESALLSAAKKRYSGKTNVKLVIDPKNCNILIYETKKVVENVTDINEEISVKEAISLSAEKKLGDDMDIPLDLHDFGRIAAQTAKQVIFQKVKEAERDIIFNEFKNKSGQIISGIVMRKEKGAYYLNIGKTEAVLFQRDVLPGENPRKGDTLKVYIEDVKISPKGTEVRVSRMNPLLVAGLFRLEVPEIGEGLVIIKDVVREPGERTKIAVSSTDPSIDPVGACVGMKGTRVQSIVRELHGERIDIIHWDDDPRILISRALSPASVDRIGINEDEKTAMVVVNDKQLSLAIGKKGQNVKLAMKLTGWDIDILSDTEFAELKTEETDKTLEDPLKKDPKKNKQ